MKKLITIAMVAFAAVAAKADTYLYWTVNPVDVARYGASYAEIGGAGSGGTFVSISDSYLNLAEGTGAGDTSLGSQMYTDYLVKLFDSSFNEVAHLTTAVNYSSALSQFAYTGGDLAQRPTNPYTFSGFTAEIPEPTSGLLLLLGLAGLALKRKVA